MHDVLAHRISLLSLHAGALEFRPDAPPDEIARDRGPGPRARARQALEELRDVIGVLREGTDGEPRPPQPTLADLPALVEESRAAGMRIEAELEPAGGGRARRIGRTAYRVVQEGADQRPQARARGAPVEVQRRRRGGDGLAIEVRNPAPAGAPRPRAARRGQRADRPRRAGRAGGRRAEPRIDEHGEFVHASLPWPQWTAAR